MSHDVLLTAPIAATNPDEQDLSLAGQVPTGVRLSGNQARLRWRVDDADRHTNFDRFLPVSVNGPETPTVTWRDFGDLPMDDPFFSNSVEKARALSHAAGLFRTDWETLSAVAREHEDELLPFAGAIFHLARTGSTLIHRLLSRSERVLSLSEIAVVEPALRLMRDWQADRRNRAIRDLVAVYRRRRRSAQERFITKMNDAGASVQLPLFRAAFPDVPILFVYRDPIEIMVSILDEPTGNLTAWYKNRTQSAKRLLMPVVDDPGMWPEEFLARTLRRACAEALDVARSVPRHMFLAVDYARLPDAIWDSIAPHFGIHLTDAERDRMRAEAQFSAKRTDGAAFVPDGASKLERASPKVRRLAERFVAPMIEELKALPQG